jgi:hypothetical protein
VNPLVCKGDVNRAAVDVTDVSLYQIQLDQLIDEMGHLGFGYRQSLADFRRVQGAFFFQDRHYLQVREIDVDIRFRQSNVNQFSPDYPENKRWY